ncbi:MAG: hypothetical protein JNL90_11500 [Planctomycetes bacterium]|nr:hypothetical protein [Planctomycetota bacterium]
MTRSPPRRRRTPLRCTLAVLAWLAVVAQVVGLPIHLAADEHYHSDHGGDHVHYGAFGHGEHHASRDARTHDHPHGHDATRDALPAAPTGCDDESRLPPHSALDHLIDSHVRRDHEASVPTLDVAPVALPAAAADELAPQRASFVARCPPAPPPRSPPPRRPEQSRAPPADLV